MNINRLKELFKEANGDLIVKNYPTLCEILEIKKSSSNGKKAQLKELASHCRFEQEGQKFIIKEIYKNKMEKIDNRGTRGKFTDDLQNILLGIMAQDESESLLFSRNMLFKRLNMTNDNYTMARRNVPKLSEITNVDEDIVYEFFNNTNDKLTGYLETALKRLRSRRLIIWEKVMVIAKVDTVKNSIGETRIDMNDYDLSTASVTLFVDHRQATEDEKKSILSIEKAILVDMGFKDAQEVFLKGKWSEYKQRVNEKLQADLNIQFHYEGYLLTYVHKNIIDELPEDLIITLSKDKVNANMINTLKTNANTRHKNALKKVDEIKSNNEMLEFYTEEEIKQLEFKTGTKIKMETTVKDDILSKDNFVKDTHKIVDTVIDKKAENIRGILTHKTK